MAITQAVCTSFKSEILQEGHQLATDTIKLALFTSSASLGAGTTAYSTSNEGVWNWLYSGWCYSHKHNLYQHQEQQLFLMQMIQLLQVHHLLARGALIYNSSNSDKAIAVLDFGGDFTVSSGTFKIVFSSSRNRCDYKD